MKYALVAIVTLLVPGTSVLLAEAKLLDVKMIWDAAPHNGFTDLTRFQDRWYCTFRQGSKHASNDGTVQVLVSDDAVKWKSAAVLRPGAQEDLRECKFATTGAGKLLLIGAACDISTGKRGTHQSYVWTSDDGAHWAGPTPVGDPGFWMWRAKWAPDGNGYSFGYATGEQHFLRLYRAADALHWNVLIDKLAASGFPNETGLIFDRGGRAVCLLRDDASNAPARVGTSNPPYEQWHWQNLSQYIGGPALLQLTDGRIVAAGRLRNPVRTSLCWLDVEHAKLDEFLKLPSGGDTSYPGLVFFNDKLWVSYYSSHEGKAKIYLAQVTID
jgi:hypothetical protein